MISMEKQIAKILLDTKAVSLQPNSPFTYASGIKSPIYCDNRVMISHVEKRNEIVKGFLRLISKLDFDIVAGTATAGIPWASWIAQELDKPMIYIRGKAKGHGKGNQIEGKLEKGQKVVVIEDLVSTGGSSVSAVEAVREAGGVVNDCIAIFTYQLKKAVDRFSEANCKLLTLTNISELVEVAVETKYIKHEEKELVLSWKEDPENWSK